MNKLTPARTFWVSAIAGFTTGMGNGSVFGAALMCALGRGMFEVAGVWGAEQYYLTTFQGFMNWCMLVFGLLFSIICTVSWARHGELEKDAPEIAVA